MKDWYEYRHELNPGDIFLTTEDSGYDYMKQNFVMLDRRVPGDGTDWYVLDWVQKFSGGYWSNDDSRIHPSELKERAKIVNGEIN